MEGMGSRQGRTSLRYGSGPSVPVLNVPVRKWKKQWVYDKQNRISPLLLYRWTPVPATADEPRKRRFRYTPIVPIKKKKNVGTLESDEAKENKKNIQSSSSFNINKAFSDGTLENPGVVDIPGKQNQELDEDQLKSNKKLINGSYSGDTTNNNALGEGRKMLINWG